MPVRLRTLPCALLVALATACATTRREPESAAEAGGGTVIRGQDLSSASLLLDALSARVPGMRVTVTGGDCPRISLRGQTTGTQSSNPEVYVDGTRMGNTCILAQILASDVDRVELYPVAATRPAGYVAGAGGLILVFRRRS